MKNLNYSWDQALKYYRKAIDLCPYRAEPLYQIANYYYKHNNMITCFQYALKASHIPFPSTIVSPIETLVYQESRYIILHNVALILGKNKIVSWRKEQLNISQAGG